MLVWFNVTHDKGNVFFIDCGMENKKIKKIEQNVQSNEIMFQCHVLRDVLCHPHNPNS